MTSAVVPIGSGAVSGRHRRGPQDELVDMVDAVLAAHAGELLHHFGRKQLGEGMADGLLAQDTGQLLELRVPTLHAVVQVRRQDAHVDRLHNILAELLEPLVLFDFALQRAVEARVLDGDADIAGQREQKFHVHAGEKIPVLRAAHPKECDRAAAHRARQVVSEIEIGDGLPLGRGHARIHTKVEA